MSIYVVNPYQNTPKAYYVDQPTHDTYSAMFTATPFLGSLIVGTQVDAQNALNTIQAAINADKQTFNQNLTIVNGNVTTVRALQDTDPENSIVQVFNPLTGLYTTYNSKTEALAAVQANIQAYLNFYSLDKVQVLNAMPFTPPNAITNGAPNLAQPATSGTQTV